MKTQLLTVDNVEYLLTGGIEWMNNKPQSVAEMKELAKMALGGHVLVAGLGLAIIEEMLARRDDIEKITIIELHQAVIDLVGERVSNKTAVICADFWHYIEENDLSQYSCAVVDCFAVKGEREIQLAKERLPIPAFVWSIDNGV